MGLPGSPLQCLKLPRMGEMSPDAYVLAGESHTKWHQVTPLSFAKIHVSILPFLCHYRKPAGVLPLALL